MAVNLKKIAGDFRLMNSGPNGGLGEIKLAPLQLGSTIMPGKVNPVIPEMVICAALKVMANDLALSMAAGHGELELNAFAPLIAESLLESLSILTSVTELFRLKAVETLEACPRRCQELLDNSLAKAVKYTASLGYDRVNEVINRHQGRAADVLEALEEELNSPSEPENS
jgi:aspartate ammonia-lyase